MAFTEQSLQGKLAELSSTQQSIQTLSLWLIHHRKHAETYVRVWNNELRKASRQRKLIFIYLANDVLQNGRKKGGPELLSQFASVLPDAFKHTAIETDEQTISKLQRIVAIWQDRKIFDAKILSELKGVLGVAVPVTKKKRIEEVKLALQEQMARDSPDESSEEVLDADEMVKLVKGLIESASSDAEVRQKIAGLPQAVSDASGLKKIKDKSEAERLAKTVEEATTILNDYNERLTQELFDRKKLFKSLAPFIATQKEKLADSQQKLLEHKEKLENVAAARKELEHHIKSLPDLSKLPDESAGLAPLPSAGDLFNV
ncbi:regulation of nuclear pre-mRNA domain-containing protein 1B-like [Watersipora subatra]|uniref:regulation of nuclear pre-mRNA domain-containing protein 1B-like n=1 Tax=Watersipora subatra TaxID=2589382 RepID=UPI00355B51ED